MSLVAAGAVEVRRRRSCANADVSFRVGMAPGHGTLRKLLMARHLRHMNFAF